MPNGSVHAKATLILAAAGGYFAYHLGHPLPQTLALSGGALVGLVLTPDLDVDTGCISFEVVRRYVGRGAARMWSLFWRPYGQLMPHRSKLSHLPVIGTSLRLAYIAILPALIWWLAAASTAAGLTAVNPTAASLTSAASDIFRPVFPAWAGWSVVGLMAADALHYVMDEVF